MPLSAPALQQAAMARATGLFFADGLCSHPICNGIFAGRQLAGVFRLNFVPGNQPRPGRHRGAGSDSRSGENRRQSAGAGWRVRSPLTGIALATDMNQWAGGATAALTVAMSNGFA